jgi:flagellar motility protein MotE (MotC chaperone)
MSEKLKGKMKSFFYFGILPFIFVVVFVMVALNYMGFPMLETVQGWAKKIPVVNHIIPDPKPVASQKSVDPNSWKQKYLDSSKVIKNKDQEITDLKNQLDSNKKHLEDLKSTNVDIQKQLDAKITKKYQDQMQKISDLYANMQPSKAAALLDSMSLEDTALTISYLDQDTQSSILSSMKDTKKAAQITMLLNEMASLSDTNQTALKDQVHQLAQQIETPTATLAETIAGMPSAQSAGIIQSMMASNPQMAMGLMKNINTNTRSQILTEITKSDAKMAALITANLNK